MIETGEEQTAEYSEYNKVYAISKFVRRNRSVHIYMQYDIL